MWQRSGASERYANRMKWQRSGASERYANRMKWQRSGASERYANRMKWQRSGASERYANRVSQRWRRPLRRQCNSTSCVRIPCWDITLCVRAGGYACIGIYLRDTTILIWLADPMTAPQALFLMMLYLFRQIITTHLSNIRTVKPHSAHSKASNSRPTSVYSDKDMLVEFKYTD
jgi:hypothetical protein